MRILMVCLGNICRSPIAEGVMRHKVKMHGLDWVVDSAGTEAYHVGDAPHPSSQRVCRAHDIDISGQKARQFNTSDFTRYDKIYAMAEDVYVEISRIGGRNADMGKVDYFLNEKYRGKNLSVPDPWYGNEQGYLVVFDMISETCDAIIENYKQKIYV
jgi:protein-tyrosine phosphatase